MAVTSYLGKLGETLWKVSVCVRSSANPGIRIQKAKFAVVTEREALREESRLERECEREVLLKEAQGSTWGAVVESFEKHLNSPQGKTLHETTRQDYIASVRKHTMPWWRRSAADLSKVDLREVFEQLIREGYSIGHLKKVKVIINRIFVYGMETRMIRGVDQSPTIGFSLGKEAEKEPEILTLGEIRKLLTTAKEVRHSWYEIWAFALLTGMRNGELHALLWTDIDWENRLITLSRSYNSRLKCVKSTKAGYWRAVPISDELNSLLLELRARTGTTPHVLPRVPDWTRGGQARELRKFCIGMGLPSIRFHTLRACFATQLIRNGVPPIQIQKICGWRDLKTMQRYIRLAGIEIEGATAGLKILPEREITEKVVNLFTSNSIPTETTRF